MSIDLSRTFCLSPMDAAWMIYAHTQDSRDEYIRAQTGRNLQKAHKCSCILPACLKHNLTSM